MNAQDVLDALKLPDDTRVEQRVPKKLLLEQGAPTVADKKAIQSGLEEVHWVAALKPSNIGVPSFKSDMQVYLEIAILTASFGSGANFRRLTELLHRAIPYPLLLIATQGNQVVISLAHKRLSQAETDAVVLDGDIVEADLGAKPDTHTHVLLESLSLTHQPTQDLRSLYQGWIERLQALAAARLTGTYTLTQTASQSLVRQAALTVHANTQREIELLRTRAAKERQINRRVDINLAIRRLEEELRAATKKLEGKT